MNQKGEPNAPCLLIVDDNEHNRSILEYHFSKFAYHILTADCGEAALRMLENEPVDLVLLDVVMPDMDGFEVLRRIRMKSSAVKMPVIMTTSLSDTKDILKALNLGANDYISKPIEPRVADARIRTHLNLRKTAEQRDHLLDMVTHDIRKPVIVMEEITQAIMDENRELIDSNETLTELVPLLGKTANHLKQYVNDFLEMRVIENGNIVLNRSIGNLNALVNEVVEKLRRIANRKKISIQTELDQSMPVASIDEGRITQVLENLIGNAIKFSPENLQIVISTHVNNESIACRVSDQGPGIKESEMSLLFKRFSSLSNKPTANEASTGLGLSICKELIELHNGEIQVKNNTDRGASFEFKIPINHTSIQ